MPSLPTSCCIEAERRVIRAVWEVVRRHQFPLELNLALRADLEAQLDQWKLEDQEQVS